ncbi:MAG: HNH endonuclease [Acidimicrobiia bacterium]
MRAWVDASAADVAARLARCASYPQAELAAATRSSVRDADRLLERAVVLEQAPVFADALDEAKVTAAHVDALGRALRSLEPAQREGLLEQVGQLAEVAEEATVEEFARRLQVEARRLTVDDEMPRLARQRRDARLRTWVDPTSGMWHLAGRFDPETGVGLAGRLDNTVAALFAEATPDSCPSDPGEKQDHLRALALVALTRGNGSGNGSANGESTDSSQSSGTGTGMGMGMGMGQGGGWGPPEFTVVVDTTATDPVTGGPTIDWGLPLELPAAVLLDVFGIADVHTVVVHNGVVLHAPGQLNAGRSTRVANRAQRRALRALHRTCAIPGCPVRYQYCKLHHVIWWEHHGRTDLDNLLPVCEKHHHAIHDLGWQVRLGPRRELTVDLPDGTRYSTAPPQRGRAAVTTTIRTEQGPTGPSPTSGPAP